MMVNDVSRASFEALIVRDVCIELSEEELGGEEDQSEWVGKLNMSLYDTCDAAVDWQDLVAKEMQAIGFRRGVYNPCTCHYSGKHTNTIVHGDDYVRIG